MTFDDFMLVCLGFILRPLVMDGWRKLNEKLDEWANV
jgi:hypothetical protein